MPAYRPAASVRRNAVLSLTAQLFSAAVTAALTIYLARELGPDQFGVFSLALAVASTLLLFSEFGVSTAAARFVAEHRAEHREVAEVLASALRLKLFLAGIVCTGLFLLAGPIASAYDEPDLTWALRAMAIALFGQNLMGLYGVAFVAMARATYDLRIVVVKSLLEGAATVALITISATAAQAAFGRAVGYGIAGLFALALSARVLGSRSVDPRIRGRFHLRRIAAYAGALFIIDGAFALFSQIDVLLIGAILTATAAGLFQAPLRLVNFLSYPAQALSNAVAPRLAARPGEEREIEPFRSALRYTILFQAMLVAPLVVWAGPIVDLVLGPDYSESAEVMRGLAPFVFLLGIGNLLSLGVNYLGEARRRVSLALACLAVNVAIDLVLIPDIGIVGGAIGTDVAFFLYVAGHVWICRDMIDLPLRPLLLSLGRATVAALAMAGLLLALGTSGISWPELFAGGAVAVLVYVAGLLLLRETTIAEIRSLLPQRD